MEDRASVEKKEARQFESCKHFLRSSNPHNLCFICRPCQPSQPCEIDQDWTNEQWAAVEAKRNEKATKKGTSTPATPAWTKFVEDAISRAMEGMTSRLAVIEQEIHGEKPQVRYCLISAFLRMFLGIEPITHGFFPFFLLSLQPASPTHVPSSPWYTSGDKDPDDRDETGHRWVKTDHNLMKLTHSRHNSPEDKRQREP